MNGHVMLPERRRSGSTDYAQHTELVTECDAPLRKMASRIQVFCT
jgi:hypothetical protein